MTDEINAQYATPIVGLITGLEAAVNLTFWIVSNADSIYFQLHHNDLRIKQYLFSETQVKVKHVQEDRL